MKIDRIIEDLRNLSVQVYLIGYQTEGESILFLVKEKDTVVFSALIDSYELDGLNKSMEILTQAGVTNLDFICWSHPDEDHTVGMLNILKRFCNKTCFLSPYGVNGKCYDVFKYSSEGQSIMDFIACLSHESKREKHIHCTASVCPFQSMGILKVTFSDKLSNDLVLSISAYSPINSEINRYISMEPKKVKKNCFSISLVFDLGGEQFLFSSDVENSTIRHMNVEDFDHVLLLKTPHHTSSSSDDLYASFRKRRYKIPLSLTTVNTKYGLPDKAVIRDNSDVFDLLYSTDTSEQDSVVKYGCIEYGFHPLEGNIRADIEKHITLYGHAKKISL